MMPFAEQRCSALAPLPSLRPWRQRTLLQESRHTVLWMPSEPGACALVDLHWQSFEMCHCTLPAAICAVPAGQITLTDGTLLVQVCSLSTMRSRRRFSNACMRYRLRLLRGPLVAAAHQPSFWRQSCLGPVMRHLFNWWIHLYFCLV